MIILLAIGGALAGLVGVVASKRQAQKPADGGQVVAVLPVAPVTQPVQVRPAVVVPPKEEPPKVDSSQQGILDAAGKVAGIIAAESAFTNTAKDVSLPVGIGVATAAYLALQVGGATVVGVTGVAVAGAGAAFYVVIPVVLVTVAIVTIVDGIARTIQADDWKKLAQEIRRLREDGQFRAALALYVKVAPTISEVSKVWPQPLNSAWPALGEDWYNAADPLGRPYAGFPGPPAPATAAEVARWPEMVPEHVNTDDGNEIPVRGLFAALQKDVASVREYGLTHKAPGRVLGPNGKPVTVTEGDRDLRGWAPYDTAIKNLNDWAVAIAAAVPWISNGALVNFTPTAAERAINTAASAAAAAAKEKKIVANATASVRRNNPTVTQAQAVAAVADARAETAAGTTAPAKERTSTRTAAATGTAETTTGNRTTTVRNNSGSGGRNG